MIYQTKNSQRQNEKVDFSFQRIVGDAGQVESDC